MSIVQYQPRLTICYCTNANYENLKQGCTNPARHDIVVPTICESSVQ
jgi:hypothetical protein